MKNCFKDSDTYPSFFPPNKAWQSSHKHKWYCTSWRQPLNNSCNANFVSGIAGLRLIREVVIDFEIPFLYMLDRVTTTLCFHFFFSFWLIFLLIFFLPIRHDRMILVSEKGWWFIKSKQHLLLLLLFNYNSNAVRYIKNNQQLA